MTTGNIAEQLENVAGAPFEMRIEDNEMIIAPAEAGIALLAAVSQMNTDNSEGWTEAERLGLVVEQLRDDNAELRDLCETIHATLVELGQDDLAERVLRAVFPVSGVMDDGTVVPFGGDL